MEQLITHACGHEQIHYLSGYVSQQERKARWLRTTSCRPCFIAGKKAEQQQMAARDGAAIAHLDLPPLTGSDRQIAWATTIRASRLAALTADPTVSGDWRTCLIVTDAKWWIDCRDLTDADLLARIRQYADASTTPVDHIQATGQSPTSAVVRHA